MYINGSRESDFATATYPAKDTASHFNTATEHGVGVFSPGTDTRFFDGYLAEIHFLDGYAYDSSYFGEFTDNGIWIPKKYSGTYPYESFYLKFTNSGNFGEDFSGNDHDFTSTNLSAHDQVTDTPTNNFTVLAPTMVNTSGGVARNADIDEGNLEVTTTSTTADFIGYNMIVPASFKSYYEKFIKHSEKEKGSICKSSIISGRKSFGCVSR